MLKYLLLISALFIAFCAAWFSVIGISSLYIGAVVAAMIMALSFELAKLVGASFLYRYWKELGKVLKYYMLIGVVVFSVITSAGIYGYLTAAYAAAATDFSAKEQETSIMTIRQNSINTLLQSNTIRLGEIQSSRLNQENRLNQLTGRGGFLTQQSLVRQSETDIRSLRQENTKLVAERDSLEIAKARVMSHAVATNGKIGTFWYVARALGVSLDSIVKWFTLLIVAVFDPMALALLIGYNFLVKRGNTISLEMPVSSNGETPKSEMKLDEWVPARMSKLKTMVNTEPIPESMTEPQTIDPYAGWPYYTHPEYDWNNDHRWKTDEIAINYRSKMQRVDK